MYICAALRRNASRGHRVVNNIDDPSITKRDFLVLRQQSSIVHQRFCHVPKRYLLFQKSCQRVCDPAELDGFCWWDSGFVPTSERIPGKVPFCSGNPPSLCRICTAIQWWKPFYRTRKSQTLRPFSLQCHLTDWTLMRHHCSGAPWTTLSSGPTHSGIPAYASIWPSS